MNRCLHAPPVTFVTDTYSVNTISMVRAVPNMVTCSDNLSYVVSRCWDFSDWWTRRALLKRFANTLVERSTADVHLACKTTWATLAQPVMDTLLSLLAIARANTVEGRRVLYTLLRSKVVKCRQHIVPAWVIAEMECDIPGIELLKNLSTCWIR